MINAVISCQDYNKDDPSITKLYSDIEWISWKPGNIPYGFMSYFGTTLSVKSDGIYTIYISADDLGTLYINGRKIGSTSVSKSWHSVSEYKVKLNTGLYGITVSVKNTGPHNTTGPCQNPSSLALFIKNPSGGIIISTDTDWKADNVLINYNTLPGVSNKEELSSNVSTGSGSETYSPHVVSNKSSIMNNIDSYLPYIEKYLPYIAIGLIAIIILKKSGKI